MFPSLPNCCWEKPPPHLLLPYPCPTHRRHGCLWASSSQKGRGSQSICKSTGLQEDQARPSQPQELAVPQLPPPPRDISHLGANPRRGPGHKFLQLRRGLLVFSTSKQDQRSGHMMLKTGAGSGGGVCFSPSGCTVDNSKGSGLRGVAQLCSLPSVPQK